MAKVISRSQSVICATSKGMGTVGERDGGLRKPASTYQHGKPDGRAVRHDCGRIHVREWVSWTSLVRGRLSHDVSRPCKMQTLRRFLKPSHDLHKSTSLLHFLALSPFHHKTIASFQYAFPDCCSTFCYVDVCHCDASGGESLGINRRDDYATRRS
jgi:hypothetical protein